VASEEAPPPPDAGDGSLTVVELRDPSSPSHPVLGTSVVVRDAVVTDVKATGNSHGFFVQDPTGTSYAGVYVFVGATEPTVAIGDVVRVLGTYSSWLGLEEIDARAGLVSVTGGRVRPAPVDVTLSEIEPNAPRAVALQSMLVRVHGVIAATATSNGDFTIGESTSGARMVVTSYMANDVGPSPFPVMASETFASITGHEYCDGVAQLAPMSANDVVRD
jgi:hypothetical protein